MIKILLKSLVSLYILFSLILLYRIYETINSYLHYLGKESFFSSNEQKTGDIEFFNYNGKDVLTIHNFYAIADDDSIEMTSGLVSGLSKKFYIKSFLKYGLNDSSVVGLVSDSLGKYYYVQWSKMEDSSCISCSRIGNYFLKIYPKNDFHDFEMYRWIDVKDMGKGSYSPPGLLNLTKDYMLIAFSIFAIVLPYFFFCLWRRKRSNTK